MTTVEKLGSRDAAVRALTYALDAVSTGQGNFAPPPGDERQEKLGLETDQEMV